MTTSSEIPITEVFKDHLAAIKLVKEARESVSEQFPNGELPESPFKTAQAYVFLGDVAERQSSLGQAASTAISRLEADKPTRSWLGPLAAMVRASRAGGEGDKAGFLQNAAELEKVFSDPRNEGGQLQEAARQLAVANPNAALWLREVDGYQDLYLQSTAASEAERVLEALPAEPDREVGEVVAREEAAAVIPTDDDTARQLAARASRLSLSTDSVFAESPDGLLERVKAGETLTGAELSLAIQQTELALTDLNSQQREVLVAYNNRLLDLQKQLSETGTSVVLIAAKTFSSLIEGLKRDLSGTLLTDIQLAFLLTLLNRSQWETEVESVKSSVDPVSQRILFNALAIAQDESGIEFSPGLKRAGRFNGVYSKYVAGQPLNESEADYLNSFGLDLQLKQSFIDKLKGRWRREE